MNGATIKEGENEAPQGSAVLTNTQVLKKFKTQELINKERKEQKTTIENFEKVSGQTPEYKKYLHEHRLDG